jgi:Peptidase A4 family
MTRWTLLRLLVLPALFGLIATGAPAAGASTLPHQVTPQKLGGWNGYYDKYSGGHTYSEVSGTWVEPKINCPSTGTSALATYVALDGYTHSTDEQIVGTAAQCANGQATYISWYQMYPSGAVLGGPTVQPGDTINASITKTGSKAYKLELTDATTSGNNINAATTCAAKCPDTSAGWVALIDTSATFQPWKVTDATVTSGTVKGVISTFPYARAGASPLNATGNGFKVS